jgi:hypothetical protein
VDLVPPRLGFGLADWRWTDAGVYKDAAVQKEVKPRTLAAAWASGVVGQHCDDDTTVDIMTARISLCQSLAAGGWDSGGSREPAGVRLCAVQAASGSLLGVRPWAAVLFEGVLAGVAS